MSSILRFDINKASIGIRSETPKHNFIRGNEMKLLQITCAALFVTAGTMNVTPAFSAGNSGNTCNSGYVWDETAKKCVRKNSENEMEYRFQKGRDYANAGQYEKAIEMLQTADAGDKRVLNYLGFSNRKLGRVDVGMEYYRQAMAIDPEYTLVREYYGEALLQKGDLKGALEQLATIQKLCSSRDCGEYQQLSGHIANYIRDTES